MSCLQRLAVTSAEIGRLTANLLSQASRNLISSAHEKAGELPLDEMTRRLDVALKVLRGEEPPVAAVSMEVEGLAFSVAEEMLESYEFDKHTGVSTFTTPAGLTDVEVIKVLNEYFRKSFPRFNREGVFAGDLDWYRDLPTNFAAFSKVRDYTDARVVVMRGVLEETIELDRSEEGEVLKQKGLVFSDPRDQAIAAALHACKYNGEDLFQGLWVRGSVPGYALCTVRRVGVRVYEYRDGNDFLDAAASGSLSEESN